MTQPLPMAGAPANTNLAGLIKNDYRGSPSTLCQGCGHNSIANQIISALYELNIVPENVIKFSGIGCSSKSPTYFLNRSFGFNGLHGRMPSLATGALFSDHTLKGIAVSGDGDTASIGMGQFKHVIRRNLDMVYVVENNGVYGLTKGQFSASADIGSKSKRGEANRFAPIDPCALALDLGATFVARSFSGDKAQLVPILKAALSHRGFALIDVISPCVTFNDHEGSTKSYLHTRKHLLKVVQADFVPPAQEITADYPEGTTKDVTMHDGSVVRFSKLPAGYDPKN